MRRSLSGLVLGLALLVGSLSWAGFVLTKTVMDPSRSEDFADQVIDNDSVRGALIGRLADGLAETVPFDAPVPRQALDTAASDALDEPSIVAELKRAIAAVHRNALSGVEEDVVLDASALGIAARDQLVGDRPELEGRLPEAPLIEVELPTAGLAFLGTIRSGVMDFALYSAIVAVIAALLALIMAKNRPAVLRRVAVWAFGTAAFWLLVGFGVPFLAQLLAPASAALIAGAIEVFFGAMIQPAVIMAGAGMALLIMSVVWPSMARRGPTRAIHARPIQAPEAPAFTVPRPAEVPPVSNPEHQGAGYFPSPRRSEPREPGDRTIVMPSTPDRDASPFANPSYEPPVQIPQSPTDGARAPKAIPKATATINPALTRDGESPSAPPWRPGVGYVDSE